MRLVWKLTAGYGLLAAATIGLVGLLASRWVEDVSLRETERALEHQARLLEEQAGLALGGAGAARLQERLRTLGRVTGSRFTVIRRDGVVLADSLEDPGAMDDHRNRPEVLAALRDGRGAAIRYSYTVQARLLYVAVPAGGPGAPAGVIRAALPLTEVDARLARLRGLVVLGAAVGLGAALVVGSLLARHVTRPLVALTDAARALARGQEPPRAAAASGDELGALAGAWNAMAAELRARMQTIVAERNELLAILAGMVEGVVAVDAAERVVHMNAVAGRLLGVDPEACQGRRVWELTRLHELCEVLARALVAPGPLAREVRLPAPGRDLVLELRAAPLRDEAGAARGAVVVVHDVSELRRLEAVRRDFVANVSHELKTPLTAIRALVETVLEDDEAPLEVRRRFLGRVVAQAERLTSLVQDLLALSRIESEEAALIREPLDLRDPVAEAVRGLAPRAADKRLALTVDLPEGPVAVHGDAEGLRQVVENLVGNAINYTPAGGRVAVRLGQAGGEALLEVEDSGIGIAPPDRERVFERFYRVDRARSRDLGGTGLGLSIVKHIALAHGGEVSVDSELGRGSTFRVKLPLGG